MSTITLTNPDHKADAAKAARYRKLSRPNRATLKRLAKGEPVDRTAAQHALFAAMRCAVTANGQSMGRRAESEKVQRVWDAVNRAKPSNDGDQEFADLEADLINLQGDLTAQSMTITNQGSTIVALNAENGRLYEQLAEAQRQVTVMQGLLEEQEAAINHANQQNDVNARALNYARSLVGEAIAARINGYMDALRGH